MNLRCATIVGMYSLQPMANKLNAVFCAAYVKIRGLDNVSKYSKQSN